MVANTPDSTKLYPFNKLYRSYQSLPEKKKKKIGTKKVRIVHNNLFIKTDWSLNLYR